MDHLRVCGADLRELNKRTSNGGSSPRVRSRRCEFLLGGLYLGIISACAEQTSASRKARTGTWDHLRVCGADEVDLFEAMCHQGSSPRVRSRPPVHPSPVYGHGIISACAEQTRPNWVSAVAMRDHLRVCGADPIFADLHALELGSSPRVRSRHACSCP